ncbi:MAG TPA: hypothetical protein VFB38_17095 [Chthonomonadaceae bacterium]|nr:hypothetical protein [Chthonomonadaceae bacterium]
MTPIWLDGFKGQHVTVYSSAGDDERTDTGTLAQIGDGWLQLIKDNGENMLYPYSAVRVVKLLDLAQTTPALRAEPGGPVDTRIYEPNAQTLP